jgi:hypothetical protein
MLLVDDRNDIGGGSLLSRCQFTLGIQSLIGKFFGEWSNAFFASVH